MKYEEGDIVKCPCGIGVIIANIMLKKIKGKAILVMLRQAVPPATMRTLFFPKKLLSKPTKKELEIYNQGVVEDEI